MIQAKDGILVEGAEQDPVEFPGRSPIAPERFFDNYARTVAAARFSKLLDDHCEGSGRDSEVENQWPRLTMACRAGKIFLRARSPVAPKKTNASEWGIVIVRLCGFRKTFLVDARR